jgi:hypothetical protein
MRAAVEATVDAGTAFYELLLETEPAGIARMRSQGVCDFTNRRAADHTVTEVPEGVPDHFQITDGGVVYGHEAGDEWHVLDVGGWGAASLLSMLGWLYGAVDARPGDSREHIVTMRAQRALEACPAPLRPELHAAFDQSGHLDAVATGRVRTDAANRITEFRLELPFSRDGLFGSVDVGSRITLTLSDFGEPAHIQPPGGAGPAEPIGEFVERFFRRAEESE